MKQMHLTDRYDIVDVKISAKWLRKKFNVCNAEFIKNICHAKCEVKASGGTLITIHPSEEYDIQLHNGIIINGLLQANKDTGKCPFLDTNGLCKLHFTDSKPFGCKCSPFTLNKQGTVVIRHRYIHLPCYKYDDGHKIPVYKAHNQALITMFGEIIAYKITQHLDNGGDDKYFPMSKHTYNRLLDNDAIKHRNK